MKKILVVDDDPDITLLVKTKLEKTGRYMVVFTNAGADAFRLAESEKPDLIVSDIDMPDKFGGDVARELSDHEATRDISVLFFSSLVSPGDIRDGMVGGRQMVSKSSSPEELIQRIDSMLS
ncbi:MAG: response regulator [Desulfobacterales bacterium]|nr:response regulator [Desulfobacterales bacterium]